MGQRHQAYLIARVVAHDATKATYRCVSAWHNQWCYGRFPPRGVRRFIDLASNRNNAEIILEELKNIDRKYGVVGPLQPRIPKIPLPFTTFLFGCAFDVDLNALNSIYASGHHFLNSTLDAAMNPSQGGILIDNNEGITVIDITDPFNIAYCHALPFSFSSPITAEEYVNAYGTDSDEEDERYGEDGTLEVLKTIRTIPVHDLAEAWPRDFKSDRPAPNINSTKSTAIPSLVELALNAGVKKAIEDDDISSLDTFLFDPSKVLDILHILRSQEVFSLPALQLIAQLIPKTLNSVDLSGFKLTTEDLIAVLSSERLSATETLNLSRNANVRLDTIIKIASTIPGINRIIAYGTSISVEDFDGLERSELASLPFLVHPARFELRMTACAAGEPGFSFLVPPRTYGYLRNVISIPLQLLNLNLIVHCISDFLDAALKSARDIYGSGLADSQTAAMSIFSAAPRQVGQSWGKRDVLFVPTPSRKMLREGWIFACYLDNYLPDWYYGFLRPKSSPSAEGERTYEIHDFDSFLAQMKAVGYGDAPVPLVEKVKAQIEVIRTVQLAKMQPPQTDLVGGEGPEVDNTADLLGSLAIGSAANGLGLAQEDRGFRLIKESELPGNGDRW
ncbi:hypothetical protein DL96DRAFT_1722516 [Flagelloscypha sp. PMI_526]|nr:hypothetical protein DL96DRAFT_1722516 [Flagelloscypha sp. PMI_526]